MAKVKDAAALFAELEQEEREEQKALAAKLKAKREKALAGLLEPLRAARHEAAQKRNECDMEIVDLDKQIAKLLGKEVKAAKPRKERTTAAKKLQIAHVLHTTLKDNKGKRYSSKELNGVCVGVPARDIVKLWNQHNKDQKIEVEGDKASTRYFVK